MREKALAILAVGVTLLMGGNRPLPLRGSLQGQLDALARRGVTYRYVDPGTIEFKETWSGNTWLRSLREPSEVTIRAWAASRGIPILEIDPSQVDTTVYAGWYTHFAVIPLSNGFGLPLILADIDGNKKTECYGAYKDSITDVQTRCYEIDTSGNVILKHNYSPLQGAARGIIDANGDSLKEVLFTFGGPALDYEQPTPDSIPTAFRFEHNRYEAGDPGSTGVYVGSLDGDSLTDFLYKGSQPDSILGDVTKVFVAEYNQQANNFVRVWSTDYGFGGVAGIGGFAVDDFDGDGSVEFVCSESIYGRVFVVENTGNNSYAVTWQDSTPFVNLDHVASGDVDGDGRPEFFVGGTTFNGSWTIACEADSNDHYSPRFMFHLAGGFFDLTYLVTDVDGDGQPELVVLASGYLHVFKSSGNDRYRLWYFRHDDNTDAVQFYDVNGDGRKDILISKGVNNVGFFADVYKASPLVSVRDALNEPIEMTLRQNFPNPFNPMTTIEYVLPKRQEVTVKVFTVLGQEVSTLVEGEENPGWHTVGWNAAGASSGVYLCRMETRDHVLVIKLLLLK